MIKTLIKHIIAEYAIDELFQNITKNFSNTNINKYGIKEAIKDVKATGQILTIIKEEHQVIYTKGIDTILSTIYDSIVIDVDENYFTIISNKPCLRQNISDDTYRYVTIGYHKVFYDSIKYIE